MKHGAFASTVADWREEVQSAAEKVLRESAVEAIQSMQAEFGQSLAYRHAPQIGIPVDTGWHVSSLRASLSAMPSINPNSFPPDALQPGAGLHMLKWDPTPTFATVRSALLGQTIYAGYTAAYSAHLEYRPKGGHAFVRKTVQRWPMIVAAVAQRFGVAVRGTS